MNITLTLASEEEMRIVRHFFLFFFCDLSQYDDNLIINEAGLPMWLPSGLPGPQTTDECVIFNWWIRDNCFHYLIRADGKPAGFANVCTRQPHMPEGVDYELLDFYIAPKYRRQGAGRQAARMIFGQHHGRWVVYELEKNFPARAFWQAVISEYTHGHFENRDDGTQQQFSN